MLSAQAGRNAVWGKVAIKVIRSYDLQTGALRWQLQFDDGSDDDAMSVVAFNNIIAVGSQAGIGKKDSSTAFTVRTYDANNGNLLWKDQIALQGDHGVATKVAFADGRLIAAGISNDDWLVRAYEMSTGKMLWQHSYHLAEKSVGIYDAAFQVTATQHHVAAAGYGSHEGLNKVSRDWVVQMYDAGDGKLLWEDRYDPAGKFDEAIGGIAISKGQVFAFGVVTDSTFLNMFIRAYDEETGKILWQDKFDKGTFTAQHTA